MQKLLFIRKAECAGDPKCRTRFCKKTYWWKAMTISSASIRSKSFGMFSFPGQKTKPAQLPTREQFNP